MKIQLGSGSNRFDDYVNIDYDAACNPDFVLDIEKEKLPFEDNTVTSVIAHHIFEHLGEGFFFVLQEIYRVCKHGAIIDVKVPHPRHDSFLSDPTHRRPITPTGLSLFSKKFNKFHENTPASKLGEYFNVDFELVDVENIPDPSYIPVFTNKPIQEVERYMHEHNNCVMEIAMKLIVVKEYD